MADFTQNSDSEPRSQAAFPPPRTTSTGSRVLSWGLGRCADRMPGTDSEVRASVRSRRLDGAFMRTLALPILSAVALIASCPLVAQEHPIAPAAPSQTNPSAPTPSNKPAEQPVTQQPQTGKPRQQPTSTRRASKIPKEQAWQILDTACTGDKTSGRAMAIRVLGLMPHDAKALKHAEEALNDDKPEVKSAAAAALGDMKAKASTRKLREALDDNDPSVALAAAHSLELMHDNSAYEVYYEVLTGQRRAGKGLIASETAILKNRKKMAQLGFEEGIGFIPFAGIGWEAVKRLTKDDSSPVRAAAAKVLAKDPDPAATKALVEAAGDGSWLVRAAALEALAKRGDPSVLDPVEQSMSDEKEVVRYTAAAAVLRLIAIKESGLTVRERKKKEKEKKGKE
jgi:hypothetical protein